MPKEVRNETGDTPLLAALVEGKLALALKLVKAGAATAATSSNPDYLGWTPLHHAASSRSRAAVALAKAIILRGGALDATNVAGDTPLDVARSHRAPLVRAVLEQAAKPVAPKRGSRLGKRAGVRKLPTEKRLALSKELFDAVRGEPSRVSALIEAGADVRATDPDDSTPLHDARDPLTAKLLIEAGADPNEPDSEGYTPLHAAASREGSHEVAKLLVRLGASLDSRDAQGATALHRAAQACNTETVRVLLELDAGVDEKDSSGWTPLRYCAQNLHLRSDRLFRRGSKPYACSGMRTPTPHTPRAF